MNNVVGRWQEDMWLLAQLDDLISAMTDVPEDIYLYDNAEMTAWLSMKGIDL